MQNDTHRDDTTPAARKKSTPNGNIGVGGAGEDTGEQIPVPAMPNNGHRQPDLPDEPGLVGREESGVKDESRIGFTGDDPFLPDQSGSPDDTGTGTHYLPEEGDAQ